MRSKTIFLLEILNRISLQNLQLQTTAYYHLTAQPVNAAAVYVEAHEL
jgi:hypothetical protein